MTHSNRNSGIRNLLISAAWAMAVAQPASSLAGGGTGAAHDPSAAVESSTPREKKAATESKSAAGPRALEGKTASEGKAGTSRLTAASTRPTEPAAGSKSRSGSKVEAGEKPDPSSKASASRGESASHGELLRPAADVHEETPRGATSAGGEGAAEALSPNAALQMLVDGNNRFVDSASTGTHRDQTRRCETVVTQKPNVAVLTCADSRVPPELIFDQGIGDLFVVRVAGNVAGTDETGTLEYGVDHLGVSLIVVMGHSRCGAVKAAVDGMNASGDLGGLIDAVRPGVESVLASAGVSGNALVSAAVRANVRYNVQRLVSRSNSINEAVRAGRVKVVGAVYDIHSGIVQWLPVAEAGEPTASSDDSAALPAAATPEAGGVREPRRAETGGGERDPATAARRRMAELKADREPAGVESQHVRSEATNARKERSPAGASAADSRGPAEKAPGSEKKEAHDEESHSESTHEATTTEPTAKGAGSMEKMMLYGSLGFGAAGTGFGLFSFLSKRKVPVAKPEKPAKA